MSFLSHPTLQFAFTPRPRRCLSAPSPFLPCPGSPETKTSLLRPPPPSPTGGGVCVCVYVPPPPNTPTPCPAAGSPLAAATLISRPSSHGAALPFVLAADDPFPPFPLSPSLFHPHPPPNLGPLPPSSRPHAPGTAATPQRGRGGGGTTRTHGEPAPRPRRVCFPFPPPPRTLD